MMLTALVPVRTGRGIVSQPYVGRLERRLGYSISDEFRALGEEGRKEYHRGTFDPYLDCLSAGVTKEKLRDMGNKHGIDFTVFGDPTKAV